MLFNKTKIVLHYLKNKKLYPNANFSINSYISSNSSVGDNVTISSYSSVINCQLSQNTKIANNSYLIDSVINDNVEIGSNSHITNSIIGEQCTIDQDCYILKTNLDKYINVASQCYLREVKINKFSYVSQNSFLINTNIGKFCSLAPGLISGPGEHPNNFVSTSPMFFFKDYKFSFADKDYFEHNKEVNIGHDVWIGARAFIKNGIKVGHGSIIASGAVVVKDVPDYAIVGGVPARIIRFRFTEDIISKLLKIQWWNWSIKKLQKAYLLFTTEDISHFIAWASEQEN